MDRAGPTAPAAAALGSAGVDAPAGAVGAGEVLRGGAEGREADGGGVGVAGATSAERAFGKELALDGFEHRLVAVTHAQFAVDRLQVGLDCVLGENHLPGDLRIAEPASRQAKKLVLALAQ